MAELIVPDTLYRGVNVNMEDLGPTYLCEELVPGTDAVNDDGERVVADGNEWGVYMSDNPQMVASAYGNLKSGQILPEMLGYSRRGFVFLEYPRVAITYTIDTTNGLAVRRPKMMGPMAGHYNNGFKGDEWIADSIPTEHYQVTKLVLGCDSLFRNNVRIVDGDLDVQIAAVQEEFAERKAVLDTFGDELRELPEKGRMNEFVVGRIVSKYRTPR